MCLFFWSTLNFSSFPILKQVVMFTFIFYTFKNNFKKVTCRVVPRSASSYASWPSCSGKIFCRTPDTWRAFRPSAFSRGPSDSQPGWTLSNMRDTCNQRKFNEGASYNSCDALNLILQIKDCYMWGNLKNII